MTSLSDFIKGIQTDYASNNLSSTLGSSVLGADVSVKGGSPWANLASNFVKGLVGGGLSKYGQIQKREYNEGINSVFGDVLGGREVRSVEGLDEDQIKELATSANLFKQVQEQDALQTLKAIKLKAMEAGEVEKATIGAQNEMFGGSQNNPKNPAAKEIVEENKILAAKKKAFDYLDKAYDQAAQIKGISGIIPSFMGGNKNELDTLNAALTYQIDNTIGREVNDVPRELFSKWAPTWYDSPEELMIKKDQFKKALESFTKPTPTLDRLGVTAPIGDSTKPPISPPAPPPGYQLTGKIDANGNYGIRKVQ